MPAELPTQQAGQTPQQPSDEMERPIEYSDVSLSLSITDVRPPDQQAFDSQAAGLDGASPIPPSLSPV